MSARRYQARLRLMRAGPHHGNSANEKSSGARPSGGERASLTRARPPLAGRIAERPIAELDLQSLGLAAAVDLDVRGLAGLEASDRIREVVGVRDRRVTDL